VTRTVVVCYFGGCVPQLCATSVDVFHWRRLCVTVVVCYFGGCVPLAEVV
jgi:hypothetical protein